MEITCQAVLELLSDFLDGVLGETEHARIEEHLARCPPCATYLEQLRSSVSALGRLACEDLPEDVRNALLATFRTWHTDRRRRDVTDPVRGGPQCSQSTTPRQRRDP